MAVMRDWMQDAANAIAELVRRADGNEDDYRATIALHSPFKDGVAYMPVPRCETCSEWHGGAEGSNETKDRKTCVAPTACGDQMDEFMTLPDFGCVLWKAKS